MNPKLVVEQKITAFANKYAVYRAEDTGKKADILALAQAKTLGDEGKGNIL